MKNVINKIKVMNRNKKIMLVSILLSVIILIAGVSYAYYSANVKENNKTETVIKTNELEIIFTGTSEITASGIVPGESFEKTFTVENVSNIPVTYNIYLEGIINEFNEDLVYTLTDEDGEVIKEEVLPSDSEKTYLITDVEIDAKELKSYTMKVEFKYTDKDQNHLQGSSFKATLGVDTKKVTVVKVVNDKLDLITMENGILTKNFIVKNLSETSQNYDIKLSDIVNTYGDNLTYSLSKNGEEVISNATMPSNDEIILEKQTISGLAIDEYTMTIKAETKTAALDLIAETEDFSAKLIVDYEESGIEKEIEKILMLDTLEKGESVTTNISVENTTNKTRKYSINLDDFIAIYAEGLVYTVTKNGTKVVENVDLETVKNILLEEQEISAKTTDEYVITVTKEKGIEKVSSGMISSTSITSGITKTATLTVENNSSKSGTYSVSLGDFVSNYASGLMYTLTKNGQEVISFQDMPSSNTIILTDQTISANGKDTYVISITKEEGIVKTVDSKLSLSNLSLGSSVSTTLTVENRSSKNGTYNVSLNDFVSTYGNYLKYKVVKNGTTVVSYQDMPTINSVVLSNQTINSNSSDTYVITVKHAYNTSIIDAYTYNQTTGAENYCVTGNETTCVKNNCYKVSTGITCESGTIIDYMVNDSKKVRFHVMYDNGDTLTLQSQKNTVYNTTWYSSYSNSKGPTKILSSIESTTSGWTNVNTLTYTLGTTVFKTNAYTGCSSYSSCAKNKYTLAQRTAQARIISMQEAVDLGCTQSSSTCPVWMINYLYSSTSTYGTENDTAGSAQNLGYWTVNANTSNSYGAWVVSYGGYMYSSDADNVKRCGRAVVEINKRGV